MGLSASKTEEEEGRDWGGHLQNQQVRDAMGTIYSNHEEAFNINTHENPQNARQVHIDKETTEIFPVKMMMDIDLDSMEFLPIPNLANWYNLSFKYKTEIPAKIFIAWIASVNSFGTGRNFLDPRTIQALKLSEMHSQPSNEKQNFQAEPGQVSIQNISIKSLTETTSLTIPLVIVMSRAQPKVNELNKVYYLFELDKTKNLKPKMLSKCNSSLKKI